MAFDPDAFLASSDSKGFDPDQWLKDRSYWSDVKQNAVAGLKQWPQAAETMGGQALKMGQAIMPDQILKSGMDVLGGKPIAQTPVGEGAKALYDVEKGVVGGAWQGIKDTGSALKAPFEMMAGEPLAKTDIGQKFRERPLSVPTGVVGTVLPAVKAFQALRGAEAGAAIPKGPYAGEMKLPEGMLEPEAVPFRPPSARWTVDAGANPGEPTYFLDAADDLDNAKVAITEMETDTTPRGSYYTVMDTEGNQIGGKFADLDDAAKYAESKFPPPKITPGETPTGEGAPPPFSDITQNARPLFEPEPEVGAGSPPPEPPPPPPGPPPPSGGAGTPPPSPGNPLKQVEDWLGKKYRHVEDTTGIPGTIGKTLQQKGRGMILKEVGATPGQVRQLKDRFGEKVVNELADLADQKGVTKGFFNWQTGDAIKKLDVTGGRNLEALRDLSTQRGAIHDKGALINQIRTELDPQFMEGTGSVQKKAYLKALQDIQNSKPDVASMAKTITKVNKFIAKNKMVLPLGAPRKVMQVATRLNNELADQFLNPKEKALHAESLKDVAAAKIYDKMYGFTFGRDMAGRTGPGSILNTIKDIGGRKVLQKVFTKVGRGIQERGALGSPKTLTADVLDAIDESLDEVIDQMGGAPPSQGMAFGGIVGEMDKYLTPRYGGTR